MARAMEIKLVLSGLQQTSAGMRQIADQTRELNRTRILPRVLPEEQTKALQAKAPQFLSGPRQQLLRLQEQRAQAEQITDPARRSAVVGDLGQREFAARRALELHQRRLDSSSEPPRNPRVPPRVLSADQAKTLEMKAPKFLQGPEQRLRRIGEQRAQLPQIANASQRQAIARDLDRAEFLAKRSIVLHKRRLEDPEESLNGPGLLETMKGLHEVIQAIATGNPGAALHLLVRGIQSLSVARGVPRMGGLPIPHPAVGARPPGATLPTASGLPAMAGPVGLAIAVIAAQAVAVKLFVDQIRAAAEEVGRFRAAVTESGGTVRSVAQLSAFGLPTDQLAATADAFRQRISVGGDPFATAAAMRGGIKPMLPAEMGGPQDNTKVLMQALRHLRVIRETHGAERQLMEARRMGLQGMLSLINVSKELFRLQEQDAELRRRVVDGSDTAKKAMQAASDLNAQSRRTTYAWETLRISMSKPFFKDVANAIGVVNNALNATTEIIERNAVPFKILAQSIPGIGDLLKWIEKIGNFNVPKDPGGDANRKALDDNTKELRKLREGTTGGGAYARGALPRDLRGPILEDAMTQRTLQKSGFPL